MGAVKRIVFTIAALAGFAVPQYAQMTTITASSIKMAGVAVSAGTVTFIPTNYTGQAIAITAGGTLYDAQGFTANITSGAIVGPFQVPDACTASPAVANTQMFYAVRVFNSATQKSFTLTRVDGVCGATWALDSYAPTQTATITATGLMSGTTVPSRCVGASIFYTLTSPVNVYTCVSGVYVPQGAVTGALSYTTLTPAALSNTNVVGAGDSRMAGTAVSAGQDFLTYLGQQPQFASRAIFYNGAVSGATCSSMTSVYAANVQPHKPSGAITTAYLMIEVAINDIGANTALATIESCYSSYVTQAVTDGFKPVIFTVYYWVGATDAQETNRQTFNNWLKTNFAPNYLVIDVDWLFPPNTGSPYYIDSLHFNSSGNLAWAQATNFLWGLGKSGTSFFQQSERDNYTPVNSVERHYAAFVAGIAPQSGVSTGVISSNIQATVGQFQLGADGNCTMVRVSGTYAVGNGCGPMTLDSTLTSRGLIAAGTAFTVTGCGTATNLKGGPNAGQFTGASTTCNPVITPGYTAPNGFACHANDFTTNITFRQTATTTTTATMTSSGTAGATDTINFECIAY